MDTPITLDKVRHLRYSANAVADLEELLGEGFASLLSDQKNVGIRHARAFLWAGLKHEDRKLQTPRGIEEAGRLVEVWYENGGNLDTLYIKIFEALKNDGWLREMSEEERRDIEDQMGEALSPKNGEET